MNLKVTVSQPTADADVVVTTSLSGFLKYRWGIDGAMPHGDALRERVVELVQEDVAKQIRISWPWQGVEHGS